MLRHIYKIENANAYAEYKYILNYECKKLLSRSFRKLYGHKNLHEDAINSAIQCNKSLMNQLYEWEFTDEEITDAIVIIVLHECYETLDGILDSDDKTEMNNLYNIQFWF